MQKKLWSDNKICGHTLPIVTSPSGSRAEMLTGPFSEIPPLVHCRWFPPIRSWDTRNSEARARSGGRHSQHCCQRLLLLLLLYVVELCFCCCLFISIYGQCFPLALWKCGETANCIVAGSVSKGKVRHREDGRGINHIMSATSSSLIGEKTWIQNLLSVMSTWNWLETKHEKIFFLVRDCLTLRTCSFSVEKSRDGSGVKLLDLTVVTGG